MFHNSTLQLLNQTSFPTSHRHYIPIVLVIIKSFINIRMLHKTAHQFLNQRPFYTPHGHYIAIIYCYN